MRATTIISCPRCPVARAGTFTTRKHAQEKGRGVACASLDQRKRSCVRVVNPWKLHVSVNENAQTIVSSLLPVFKGFYDTHMRHTSVSYRHAKRSVHFIYIYANTETRTCMHGLHDDEIHFTSMDAILKRL